LSVTPPRDPISIDPLNAEMLQHLEEHGELHGVACPGCKRTEGKTDVSRVWQPALVVVADHRSIQASCRFCEWKMEVERD
jgi:hypothetical protein